MQRFRIPTILAFVFCLLLAATAGAQELSVRNKPYKGEVKGRGMDMLVRLEEMAKALDMPAAKTDAGWTLADTAIPTVDEAGVPYIKLSDLGTVGCKVTLNNDFNIIDVTRPVARAGAPGNNNPAWSASSSGLTMVHFGATW